MVSVLITSYNPGRYLQRTIESVLRQTYVNWEIIVIDDGSTDGSVDRLAVPPGVSFRLLRQPNLGAPVALGQAAREARGELLALLDHDDLWHPDKIRHHVDAMTVNRALALTFSWSELIDEDDQPLGLHPKRWRGPISYRQLLCDFVIGNTSSIVLRRDVLERAGGFDPAFTRYYDYALCLRLAAACPAGIASIPRPLTYYRRHRGQMSRDPAAMAREWEVVVAKLRDLSPETIRVESIARANMNRYFAYLANESGDPGQAIRFLREGLRSSPALFWLDPRNLAMAALAGWGYLRPRQNGPRGHAVTRAVRKVLSL